MLKKILFIIALCIAHSSNVCFAIGMEINNNVKYADLPSHLKFDLNTAQTGLKKGFIDVTKSPYNATGNGSTDDWQAIQNAINDGYTYNFVVFFPGNKTYLVSQQLNCVSRKVSRKFGYQLVGSTKGAKPIIKLKDNCDIITGNILILYHHFNLSTNSIDPSTTYMCTFKGIDIDMGSGTNNSNTSALSMDGAQYCVIEDVKIYGSFNAGVWKLPGSGGGVVNLTVIGGKIGVLQDAYRPNPTIFGLVLENQSQYGIQVTVSRGPVIIAGFKIASPENPSSTYRAINLKNTASNVVNGIVDHGQANLCLSDGSIEVKGASGKAIDNFAQDVTMNNVYIKSAQIIESGVGGSGLMSVAGNAVLWSKITNYIFTSSLDKSTVYKSGVSLNNRTANYQFFVPLTTDAQLPNIDFTRLHSWTTLPSWEDANIVDITEGLTIGGILYKATPEDVNATDDDGIAIQKIIDEVTNSTSTHFGRTVFIARGFFQINTTLRLKSGLKLIGSTNGNSCIMPNRDWNNSEGPIVDSEDAATGSLFLYNFGIIVYPHQKTLHIKTANTFISDLLTESVANRAFKNCNPTNKAGSIPYFEFTGNAGGKIYNLITDQIPGNCDISPNVLPPTTNYQFLNVEGNKNPLTFYHMSIEHLANSPQSRFKNAKNITVFGFKYESEKELLEIVNSDNIQLIGGSGNYSLQEAADRAIIVIINSTKVLIENFNRKEYSDNNIFPVNTKWISHNGSLISGDYGVLQFENLNFTSTIDNASTHKSAIKVFPNPTTHQLIIQIDEYSALKGGQMNITTALGQKVFQSVINSEQISVDTKNWGASGIYFMTITNKQGALIETKKIIKER